MLVTLRLYVAAHAPMSEAAERAVRATLDGLSDVVATLEVVDVFAEPDRAERDHILVTPTLLRIEPEPVRAVIGDLSDEERIRDLVLVGEPPP